MRQASDKDPIADKVRHVKNATQTRDHTCHWPGCNVQVKPAMWGCATHWGGLPYALKEKMWAAYRPGQENDQDPSERYLAVEAEIQAWIANRHWMRPPTDDPKAEVGGFERRTPPSKPAPPAVRPHMPATDPEVQSALYQLALHFADRKAAVIPLFEQVKEEFAERAGIREYLGDLPRHRAELEGYRDTVEVFNQRLVPRAR